MPLPSLRDQPKCDHVSRRKIRHIFVGRLPFLISPLQTSHCPLLCPSWRLWLWIINICEAGVVSQNGCEPKVSFVFSVACSPASIADARPWPTDLLTYQPCDRDDTHTISSEERRAVGAHKPCLQLPRLSLWWFWTQLGIHATIWWM
jgi:hypothetical protein